MRREGSFDRVSNAFVDSTRQLLLSLTTRFISDAMKLQPWAPKFKLWLVDEPRASPR
jgi:hypothetical protein